MILALARLAGWGLADVAAFVWACYAKDANRIKHAGDLGPITRTEWAALAAQLTAAGGSVAEVVRFTRGAL